MALFGNGCCQGNEGELTGRCGPFSHYNAVLRRSGGKHSGTDTQRDRPCDSERQRREGCATSSGTPRAAGDPRSSEKVVGQIMFSALQRGCAPWRWSWASREHLGLELLALRTVRERTADAEAPSLGCFVSRSQET